MEIPYHGSTAESEGQRSSIVIPPASPPTLVDTTNSSIPTTPANIVSVTSAVSNLLNRNRQRSQRHSDHDEMKWSIRRRGSSKEEAKVEEVPLNNDSSSENANDCRVTVV